MYRKFTKLIKGNICTVIVTDNRLKHLKLCKVNILRITNTLTHFTMFEKF